MSTPELPAAIEGYDQQSLDAIVWPRIGKRFRECTPAELDRVLAKIHEEIAEDRRASRAAELRIAAGQAAIDQYLAAVADGIRRAEKWANGGVA
ncbi:hypothetical protein [Nocardia puris]|uniref:DivIVA domain-containing protein n=1 Tax=Nocardia puris TaxID=208602 RepID=A0A366CY33_9NOCA|nr:hypothetical protein [Nocardia puris]RBO82119.1 hypothetical protein DFR74_12574 [Nocardia puris]